MEDKSNIIFNISGGNNQILPNATQAVQNFYGDQFVEEALKEKTNSDRGNLSSIAQQTIKHQQPIAAYVHLFAQSVR